MLKKIVITLMVVFLIVSFMSCGSDSATETNGTGTIEDAQAFVEAGSYTYTTGGGEKEVVTIDITHDFYISKYEVSVANFCDMLNYGIEQGVVEGDTSEVIFAGEYVTYNINSDDYKPSIFNGEESSGIVYNEQTSKFELTSSDVANYPMNNINYSSAAFFCNMASRLDELNELYTYGEGYPYQSYEKGWLCNYYGESGYRLPTKAEWTFAYKGGNNSKGYEYSGSNNRDDVGWSWEYTAEPRHNIAQKSANELGIYDMTGNIAELNSDHFGYWYENYYVDPVDDYDQLNPYSTFLDGGLQDDSQVSASTEGFSYRNGFRLIKYIYSNPDYNMKPSCEIQDPANYELFNQGDIIEASVKSFDTDGTVAKVEFYLDGNLIGSDLEVYSTFYFNYDVPTTGLSEGIHIFKAIAIDDGGAKMESEQSIRISDIVNASAPTPVFTISPEEGNIQTDFEFDATGSTDDIDDENSMRVRWDFNGDGVYDTSWTGAWSIETYNYAEGDTCYVKMEIKDSGNRKATTILQIKVSDSVPAPPEVLVVGGTFSMGDHYSEGESNELPLHDVTLDDFYIGIYEVTDLEYENITGSGSYGGDNPVVYVYWYEVINYCNKLSELHGLTSCYSGSGSSTVCDFSANGYRLPTEAEWEYAARGGVNHTDDYRYSGCNDESDLPDYAVYDGASTSSVGSKLPNQLGIYDMSGNVEEWCWDWYDEYSSDSQTNPTGPESGSDRIVRGGYGYSAASRVSSSYRNHSSSYSASRGFRVVRKN